jgi:insecticidal toxin complex protein TccC
LELDDKVQTLSYEHYYPYGGTAIIAGKDKTQVQQKRYKWIVIHINIQIQAINRPC